MAEGFKMSCPRCGQSYRFNDAQLVKFAGKTLACRKCRKAFTVPKIQVAAPAPPPPPEEPVLREEEEEQEQEQQPVTSLAVSSRSAIAKSAPAEEPEPRDDNGFDTDTPFRKERYSRPRIEPQLDLQARPDDIHHGIYHDEPASGREPGGFDDTGAYRAPVGFDDLPPQNDYHPGVFDDEAHDEAHQEASVKTAEEYRTAGDGEEKEAAGDREEKDASGNHEHASLSVTARDEAAAEDTQSSISAEDSVRIEEEERPAATEEEREGEDQQEPADAEVAETEPPQRETALAQRQSVLSDDQEVAREEISHEEIARKEIAREEVAQEPAGEFLQPLRPPVREAEVVPARPAPERPFAPAPAPAPTPAPSPKRPTRSAQVATAPVGYEPRPDRAFNWGDFFSFRSMIALPVIQGLFWLGVIACIVFGALQIYGAFNPSPAAPAIVNGVVVAPTAATPRVATSYDAGMLVTGLLTIFLGPLIVRIYCEILIVIFRINETLTEIKQELAGK